MALLVTVKHLTTIKGLPYFQRRIPKRLLQHPAIKSTHYKVRLPVDPTDELALLSALNRANCAFFNLRVSHYRLLFSRINQARYRRYLHVTKTYRSVPSHPQRALSLHG